MSAYKAWVAKQRGNPLLLIVAVVGFTSTFLISYRQFYVPWDYRRKIKDAENFANLLYEKESKANDV